MGVASAADGQRSRLEGFEGLRALAALSVFAFHFLHWTAFPRTHWTVWELVSDLNAGVVVFFVISGFLLYLPFSRANAGLARRVELRSYLVRRALRIYPGYWLALAGSLAFLVPDARFDDWGEGVRHALLVHSYGAPTGIGMTGMKHAWTLVVEVSFYLFLPIFAVLVSRLAARVGRVRGEWTGVVAVAALGLAAQAFVQWGEPPRWVMVLPAFLFYFAIGIGLAVGRVSLETGSARSAAWGRVASHVGAWWLVALVAFSSAALLPGPLSNPIRPSTTFVVFVAQGLMAFALVAPFTVVRPGDHPIRRVVRSRPMELLGLISYGIYLWHPAVLDRAVEWFGRGYEPTMLDLDSLALPVTLGVTLLLAWAGYRLVEKPAIRWSHRLTRSLAPATPRTSSRKAAGPDEPEPNGGGC